MTIGAFQNVGIVSIGDMGLGIARILLAHGYRVFTYAEDRRFAQGPIYLQTLS